MLPRAALAGPARTCWARRPLRSLASSAWGRIVLCSRGRCKVAGHAGLSALACVFPVGSDCTMLAGPVRSGWACRLLCANLCLPCGVELRWACGASAEWLGLSASLRSLVSWLWGRIALCLWNRRGVAGLVGPSACFAVSLPGRLVCCCGAGVEWLGSSASLFSLASSLWSRIAFCSRGQCGVAGPVDFSALACVFPVGSNCIMLAGPVRSGWACRPLCAHLSSLWVRIALWLRVGLSALACVFPVGSECAALAEPARSGWARRPLCVRLCPCCGVGLCRLFVCLYVCCCGWCGRSPCVYLFLA